MNAAHSGLLLCLLILGACSRAVDHHPLDATAYARVDFTAIAPWRRWGDERPADFEDIYGRLLRQVVRRHAESGEPGPPTIDFLAISGGGADGAFGAGLLAGWSESGKRPEFEVVTGVSTGAIIAPFAFLGEAYDDTLVALYGAVERDDIYRKQAPIGSLLFSSALSSTKPLRRQVEANITPDLVRRIAEEGHKGRRLLVGTTQFDALRPVVWDLTELAQRRGDAATPLIHDIILASAAIPVLFPPVAIGFEAGGQRFTELHVDGGVSNQVFAYPASVDPPALIEQFGVAVGIQMFVIQNGNAQTRYAPAPVKIGGISERAIGHLIRSHGNRDIERIYFLAQRDGIAFHHASIPASFNADRQTDFDPTYMRELLAIGRAMGRRGNFWNPVPPGLALSAPE